MATTDRAVRAAIAARIVALGGDWKESRFSPDTLGRDSSSVAQCAFSVAIPNTRASGARQRELVLQTSSAVVRFTWRVMPKDQVSSYDLALDAETILLRQIMAPGWTSLFQMVYVSSLRSTLETGEWIAVEMTFNALYYVSLE